MYHKQERKKGCKKACRARGVGLTTKNKSHGYALCRKCGLANRRKTRLVKRGPKANWHRYLLRTREDPGGIRDSRRPTPMMERTLAAGPDAAPCRRTWAESSTRRGAEDFRVMTSMLRNDEALGSVRFPSKADSRLPSELVRRAYEAARKHSVHQRPAQGGVPAPSL